jgi:hypothetical protein
MFHPALREFCRARGGAEGAVSDAIADPGFAGLSAEFRVLSWPDLLADGFVARS